MTEAIAHQLKTNQMPFLDDVLAAFEYDDFRVGNSTSFAVRSMKAALKDLRSPDNLDGLEALDNVDANFLCIDSAAAQETALGGFKYSRSLTRSIAKANRKEIVEFGYWYQDRIAYLGKQLLRDQTKLNNTTMELTEQLVDQNVLPKKAVKIMSQSIEWAGPVKPIGSIEQVINETDGYCDEDGIQIANLYDLPETMAAISPRLMETYFHEILHGVGEVGGKRRSFFYGVVERQKDVYQHLLEEAYVGEVSEMAVSIGLDDADRKRLSKCYPLERTFVEIIMRQSNHPLTWADLSAGFFSGRSRNALARYYIETCMQDTLNEIFPEYEGKSFPTINFCYQALVGRKERISYMTGLIIRAEQRIGKYAQPTTLLDQPANS